MFLEVVDALAGCAKWALDLLAWLADCLFNLLVDDKFIAILKDPKRFFELTTYLQSQNDVSLHLLLCSSTRGFLSAACRRLILLHNLSRRAVEHYEERAAKQSATDPSSAASRIPWPLYYAYKKVQRFTSGSLVKVEGFDELLSTLSRDIRIAYQTNLPGLTSQAKTQNPPQQGGTNDPAVKRAQIHCELSMLLAASPPPSFQGVLSNFFDNSLKDFRAHSDQAKLYFADYSLLEVDDNRKTLAARRAKGRYVDVFKRFELVADVKPGASGSLPSPPGEAAAEGTDTQWRRCVRCASVMENVYGQKQGFTFVLAQQRKCSCGGSWGILPKGSLVS